MHDFELDYVNYELKLDIYHLRLKVRFPNTKVMIINSF